MSEIVSYQQNYDGTYSIVVNGVFLDDSTLRLIDNNIPVNTQISILDGNFITDKQRKLIFALCNDIENHTGQPREYMRYLFQEYITVLYGYPNGISLSDCTREQAKQIIDAIIEWVFLNDIPLQFKTSDLLKKNKAFLYYATITRHCVICGKPNSDLAHYEAVGRGMNRNKIEHYGKHVLALCREHHQEQHSSGIKTFNNKYHLNNSWIEVDEILNKMLKGQKN